VCQKEGWRKEVSFTKPHPFEEGGLRCPERPRCFGGGGGFKGGQVGRAALLETSTQEFWWPGIWVEKKV